MEIITSYYNDVGITKKQNQDSLAYKVVNTKDGKVIFAIICDGVGGLEHGELASKEVVVGFTDWFMSEFVCMLNRGKVAADLVYESLNRKLETINKRISEYAKGMNIMMGTTLTMLLTYQNQYYVFHVGDSKIFRIKSVLQQITEEHTVTAELVREGILTEEQAKKDRRRNVLTQCVGVSEKLTPQFVTGLLDGDMTFLLCSDGFSNMLTREEIYSEFRSEYVSGKKQLETTCREMAQLAMERGERDNITVIGVVITKNTVIDDDRKWMFDCENTELLRGN